MSASWLFEACQPKSLEVSLPLVGANVGQLIVDPFEGEMRQESAYGEQLRDYLEATGAQRGAVVFLTLGEVAWIERSA
jgi:hypothetical protein